MTDFNKMELSQQKAVGCAEGCHKFSVEDANIVPNGELTSIIAKCIICNQYVEMSSQLNLNDLLQPKQQEATKQLPPLIVTKTPSTQPDVISDEENEILRKILGY